MKNTAELVEAATALEQLSRQQAGAAEPVADKPEAKCKCGLMTVREGFDGNSWYWQRHSRELCYVELPNSKCWCGRLRSEHTDGHDPHARYPDAAPSAPQAEAGDGVLRRALQLLYDETADYIRLNKLGDVHHNRSMQLARDALRAAPAAEKPGDLESALAETAAFEEWFYKDEANAYHHAFTAEYKLADAAWQARAALSGDSQDAALLREAHDAIANVLNAKWRPEGMSEEHADALRSTLAAIAARTEGKK